MDGLSRVNTAMDDVVMLQLFCTQLSYAQKAQHRTLKELLSKPKKGQQGLERWWGGRGAMRENVTFNSGLADRLSRL